MRKNQRRRLGSDGSGKKRTTSDPKRRIQGTSNQTGSSSGSTNSRRRKKRSSGSSSRTGRTSSSKKSPKFLKFHFRKCNQMVKIDLNNYEIIGKGSFGIVFITRLNYLKESPTSPLGRISPFSQASPPSPTSAPFINPPQEQHVAIKRVFQDERYKNRELEIMKLLNKDFQHFNLVGFYYYFYEEDRSFRSGTHKRYLNIVMEYLPDQTLYHFYKKLNTTTTHNTSQIFGGQNSTNPRINYIFSLNNTDQIYYFLKSNPNYLLFLIKIFMYQLIKSVNYLHCLDVCHRDIKFQNILLGLNQQSVKLCDFGSAKILQKNEKNISYICSRYYRAPELIFGHRNYNYKIDNWSIGCVFGEMILMGKPLFKGENSNDQILKIINFLGSPNAEESLFLFQKEKGGEGGSSSSEYQSKFPSIKKQNLMDYFNRKSPKFFKLLPVEEKALLISLLECLITYDQKNRVDLILLLAHPFFDAIKMTGRNAVPFKVNPNIFKFHLIELKDWKKKLRSNQELISDYIKKGIKFNELKKILNFK